MGELDGVWRVKRTGGALPPMVGVTKRIAGSRGETRVGPFVRMPFLVEGMSLHYLPPWWGLVDVLEPDGSGFKGKATWFGRELGRFALRGRADG